MHRVGKVASSRRSRTSTSHIFRVRATGSSLTPVIGTLREMMSRFRKHHAEAAKSTSLRATMLFNQVTVPSTVRRGPTRLIKTGMMIITWVEVMPTKAKSNPRPTASRKRHCSHHIHLNRTIITREPVGVSVAIEEASDTMQ